MAEGETITILPRGGQGPDDLRTYILTNLAQISAQVVIVFQVIVVALAVCQMVCARCGQWIENQWLFWRYWDPSRFLPPDVQFVSYWDPSLFLPPNVQFVSPGPSYFFCACCTIAKYENEGWTPGSYQNEDGHESTDDEDEHFLCVHLPYCRSVARRRARQKGSVESLTEACHTDDNFFSRSLVRDSRRNRARSEAWTQRERA